MPSCLAYQCANTTGRTNEKKGFFIVPRPVNRTEKLRATRWLHNIGTGLNINKFTFGKNSVVCEDHFHPLCIKDDIKARVMGLVPKKKALVDGAVPTIFKHKVYEEINMDSTKVLKRNTSLKRKVEVERTDVSYSVI